jgi:hypothetical protein
MSLKKNNIEEHLGDSEEDPIYVDDELDNEQLDNEQLYEEQLDDDDDRELLDFIKKHPGDTEDEPHNIEEQPEDIEEHLDNTENDIEDVDISFIAYVDNAERQRLPDKESMSSRIESLDAGIHKLEAKTSTLESINVDSKGVSVENLNSLLNRIQVLEAQLAVKDEGRAQSEELNRALLSTSRSSRSPSPEPQAAIPPIHPPTSRSFRSTRAARPPNCIISPRLVDSRISKCGPTRRRHSITHISIPRFTFAEQMICGACRQRWWGWGGAALGTVAAALREISVKADIKVAGKVFEDFARLIEGR